MPTTKSKHLINTTVLADAVEAAFAGMKALWGTRAVIVRTDMPSVTTTGGRILRGAKIQIPYFNALGDLEDLEEGDALTPRLLTMSDEEAEVKHSGMAVEITNFAVQFASGGSDPYAETARQFREVVERRADKALLDVAGTALPSEYSKVVYDAVTPVNLDWDVLVDARLLWGDEQNEIELLVVHSKVYGSLLKLKDANGRPLLVDPPNGEIARFLGIPIKISDQGTVDDPKAAVPKYRTRIYKRNSLIFWMNGTPNIKEDDDIYADTHAMAIHIYWAAHRYKRPANGTHPGVIEIVHNAA